MSDDRLTPAALREMARACRDRARTGTIADFKGELMRLADEYEKLAAELDVIRARPVGDGKAPSGSSPTAG